MARKKPKNDGAVEKKLVGVADVVITAAQRSKDPTLSIPVRSLADVTLAALREELHVRAENSGTVVGPLVLVDDGDRVDCTRLGKGGYSVPSIVEPEYIQITRCTADFVLLVKKGTQWNRLSEDKFWRRYNCVLLTRNGPPPRGLRRLARRLN